MSFDLALYAVDVVRVAISAFKSPKRDSEVDHAMREETPGSQKIVEKPSNLPRDLEHMKLFSLRPKHNAMSVTSHFKLVFLTVVAITVGAGIAQAVLAA